MTPARRRRLFRSVAVVVVLMGAGLTSRLFFLNQGGIPSLLLGRKPGSARPGTVLVHAAAPSTRTNLASRLPRDRGVERDAPVQRVKFDLLGGWKFVEGKTPIPEKVRQLDGCLVEISGFMMPINETKNIQRFIVVQSLWGCCFGQVPAVNHVVVVNMVPGKAVNFYPDPVCVTGRFFVGETREEGYLVSIYRLEANWVTVR